MPTRLTYHTTACLQEIKAFGYFIDNSQTSSRQNAYSPWCRYRNPETWEYDNTADLSLIHRGYTGHEMLPEFDLIHMNGRMYDPILGRMLSPDNYVQDPTNPQNYNRYSYCLNNPLKYTDPDGEFITWSFGNGGFSIGLNFTPIGIPLGFGINIGYGNGFAPGLYGEIGYRVGGTGLGSGVTLQQSLDYNFKYNSWSTTTSEVAYASFGAFNVGVNFSQTYGNSQWSYNWGVSAGVGIGDEQAGMGFYLTYGSGGLGWGLGGYYDARYAPVVYTSPVTDNYGTESGQCVLLCLEEFSESYGMNEYDYNYWFEQNESILGVNPKNVEKLINNTDVFASEQIAPQTNINIIADAFTNDQRVLMGFQTTSGGGHAVMVSKLKIWSSGRYRVYFSETSRVRVAPYSTSNLFKIEGAGFWTFYPR